MVAVVRARAADIPMGMTQVEDGDAKVLLIRDTHGLRAFQANCPHYGAPLAKGKICGTTLYCPWHKAAFEVGDGALREPPALEGLEQYPIHTEGENIVVTLEAMATVAAARRSQDEKSVVIVGTGAAAVAAVGTLREGGYAGRIVMVGPEQVEPYDRPKLSKNFLQKKTDPAKMVLQKNFYAAHDVEFIQAAATKIDVATRRVTLEDGRTVEGDAMLIATGSKAVVPQFPGRNLGNIFTLRTLSDAVALSAAAETAKSVTIVGGGFIGLEAAAFLTKRGLAATVIAREPLPLSNRFGDDVARALKTYHEGAGVRFLAATVERFEGENIVRDVRLKNGTAVPTDLVLIAAGAAPETACIEGVAKRDDGGIAVDATLRVATRTWLAGDIAAFPDRGSETMARIEHWRLAEQHGRHAAQGILGSVAPFTAAPFFWSNQGEKRLDYAGYAPAWDELVVHGDIGKLDFIVFYLKKGKALAACAIGRNAALIAFLDRLDNGCPPTAAELSDFSVEGQKVLQGLGESAGVGRRQTTAVG